MAEYAQSFEDEFNLDFEDFDLSFSNAVVDSAEGQAYYNDGSGNVGFAGPLGLIVINDQFNEDPVEASVWTNTSGTIANLGGVSSLHLLGATQSVKSILNLDTIEHVGKLRFDANIYYVNTEAGGINFIGFWGTTADTWIGFQLDNASGSEKWKARVSNNGVETTSSAFTIAAEAWRTIRIEATHNIVKFYVNSVRVATISTNIRKTEVFNAFVQSNSGDFEIYVDYLTIKYINIPA